MAVSLAAGLGPDQGVLILSEPLDGLAEQWIAVPQSHLLVAGEGGLAVLLFAPAA